MSEEKLQKIQGHHTRTNLSLYVIFAILLAFFLGGGIVAFLNIQALSEGMGKVTHTHDVLEALEDVQSLMKDAETGQRGFILTGDERYLSPYTEAANGIESRLNEVERLTADNESQQGRLPMLRERVAAKLKELEETIGLRRTRGFEEARAVVISDRGKTDMDEIRKWTSLMEQEERDLRRLRFAQMDSAYRTAVTSGLMSTLLGVVLSCVVTYLVQRALQGRNLQEWLLLGKSGLGAAILGDQRFDQIGNNALKYLAEYLGADAGAFFSEDGGRFRRAGTYGVPDGSSVPESFGLGDGLLGQAAKDQKTFHLSDVPDGYLTIGSALGRGKPRHLIIFPVVGEGTVRAVIELGFFQPIDAPGLELLQSISSTLASTVLSANYRAHLQSLLEETQRQTEELQAQGEELRVSNEELEEQSRALRESQSRLEQQQAELEQTNTQLEEQANMLENERDQLTKAKTDLQTKAKEVEQASQYKSNFLANMSHELRTPLNSSLILSKLLADNPAGNLTEEQVQYAETIRSAGNDLLLLINDILDLSKIEAGRMEVRPEIVQISKLVEDLGRTFHPMAKQKGIEYSTHVTFDDLDTLETDRQRLEQIIKNLLSNALKFTEKGHVELTVSRSDDKEIAFAVRDTGIGISAQQQQIVFEAFRQADGKTNRKYGGTGLGLSISRELARLLGGEISLVSEPGQGSIFTLRIPIVFRGASAQPQPAPAPAVSWTSPKPAFSMPSSSPLQGLSDPIVAKVKTSVMAAARPIPDDRAKLTSGNRLILVVEDDQTFARILYDLAHELDFQCVIANSAEEAIATATQLLPSAVVLDIGLPDHSGLSVLDRLKHDPRTRHIPVHVVSAGDFAQTALSLGAVGYMPKPVKREELAEALRKLESRLHHRMRQVLVVEDDPVQLDSLRKLLGSHEVETVGAASAAQCLEKLKGGTFDCMVLDLSLPDASGYSLLETLSNEENDYSFPPVIVYTGRDLSYDEEQRLRRYSKSIIIKGAKSPERLLDEVTLFLHQVVGELPPEQQRMLAKARNRDATLESRRILVVEDDVRNVFALTNVLEQRGVIVQIARNGREGLEVLAKAMGEPGRAIDLILMDMMMPEMDGLTAIREIRKRPEWGKLPIIVLTAKAMRDDQEKCLAAGANDYMAKPLDIDKLLSLVRVWMPR